MFVSVKKISFLNISSHCLALAGDQLTHMLVRPFLVFLGRSDQTSFMRNKLYIYIHIEKQNVSYFIVSNKETIKQSPNYL